MASSNTVGVAKLGPNPAHPISLAGFGVDRGDRLRQVRVITITRRSRPGPPFIKPRGRNIKDPAGHRDGETRRGQLLDQPEPYFGRMFSLAK